MGRLGIDVVDKCEPIAEVSGTRGPRPDGDSSAANDRTTSVFDLLDIRDVLDDPRAVHARGQCLAEPLAERGGEGWLVDLDAHVGEHADAVTDEGINIGKRRNAHAIGRHAGGAGLYSTHVAAE